MVRPGQLCRQAARVPRAPSPPRHRRLRAVEAPTLRILADGHPRPDYYPAPVVIGTTAVPRQSCRAVCFSAREREAAATFNACIVRLEHEHLGMMLVDPQGVLMTYLLEDGGRS